MKISYHSQNFSNLVKKKKSLTYPHVSNHGGMSKVVHNFYFEKGGVQLFFIFILFFPALRKMF